MNTSHLVLVLRTLSKKEERDLRKWLCSPVHNQREDVAGLFEYLMSGTHLHEDKFLRKERVFSRLFPDEPYDDAKLRQSMHFLLKVVEEFLIHQEQRGDEVRSRMALSSVYRKRKLDRAFRKAVKGVETLQEKSPYRNEQFLRNEYLLQIEKYQFQEGKKRTTEMNLQEVSDALDTTFIADKLRQTCLMLSHQAVYKVDYRIGLLDEVLSYVEQNELEAIPAIAAYYFVYRSITDRENSSTYFEKLKGLIKDNGGLFPHHELRDIYLMAINYCVSRINAGDGSMRVELFELYRNGIEDGTLIENNALSHFTFRNIVNLGTALKEFDWINTFISGYQQYLSEKYRETFVQFSKAKLHFTKREYDKAMQLLAQSDFDDILTNLYGKSMLIIMYYEQDEFDALESLLESMRTYMRRKQVMGSYKAIYTNLIKYSRKLIRINPYDQQQVTKLRQEVETAKPLPEKEWFLEQLDKL
jgi:hypothetical protein